jgi:hypothetical protein
MSADAIAQLYAAFGSYRPAGRQQYCRHCVSEADVETLASRPLWELDAGFVSNFVFDAMSTWGGVAEFSYALPRILELVLAGEAGFDWLLASRIAAARGSWTDEQQAALEAFHLAYWRRVLSRPLDRTAGRKGGESRPFAASDALRDIAGTGSSLQPLLADLLASRHPNAMSHFAQVAWNSPADPDEPWQQELNAWLITFPALEKLDAVGNGKYGPPISLARAAVDALLR